MIKRGIPFALLLVALPLELAKAQSPVCEQQAGVWVLIGKQRLALSSADRERLPYGRDMQLLFRPSRPANDVRVAFELTGGTRGPREGDVQASKVEAQQGCWAAALPPLHLNEVGTFNIEQYRPALLKAGRTPAHVASAYLRALLFLPNTTDNAVIAEATHAMVDTVLTSMYEDSISDLLVRTADGETINLRERLRESVLRNYAIAGQLAVIGDAAQQVGDIIDALIEAEPSLARRHSISCSVASTVPELQAEARRLAAQTPEENAGMVARGELPWPDCVVDLIAGFTHEDASVLALRDFAHDVIIPLTSSNRALAELLAFARQVEALTVQTIRVGTVEVPIGADVLERYTQVDLVTVYMPSGVSMIQPFAAATLYFLDSSQQDEFTARIRPRTWADRVGLQVGYPVGSPLNDPDEPFEPDMMVGLIIRANKQLSGSVGVVFGRNDEGRDNVLFFSTNFDVSSLGALQNLLARRDP